MLLEERAGASVADVVFAEGTTGTHLRRPLRVALSFVRRPDEPFSGQLARFVPVESDPPWDASSLGVLSATCYDRLGWPLSEPGVEIR